MSLDAVLKTHDEIYTFLPDKIDDPHLNREKGWKVLIVDDDEGVHEITKIILNYFKFEGQGVTLLSAYNEEDAIHMLNLHSDIAIILLDVVMDSDTSGLKLVRYIREILMNRLIRIVLRTGQPGQAPEKQVVVNYDINDYKLKTELTADKLFVTIISALRSYKDLVTLDNHSITLRRTISSTSNLYRQRTLSGFIQSIPDEFCSILGNDTTMGSSHFSGMILSYVGNEFIILEGIGIYKSHVGERLGNLLSSESLQLLKQTQSSRKKVFSNNEFAASMTNNDDDFILFYLVLDRNFSDWDISLIEIYASSIKSAYNTLYLADEIDKTHREIIFTLGEIAEARSKETGNHVKRVSEYSRLLAHKLGLQKNEVDLIALASPVHDIGKISIPDYILNKPGKLTLEEFEIIKTHATVGYEMLNNSRRPILQAAATIALQHHEKWDGTGYPNQLSGTHIHIFGRIVALADVFDALGSDRVYKKAWPLDKIIEYIQSERGHHFDPAIIDIFMENLSDFLEIRTTFHESKLTQLYS